MGQGDCDDHDPTVAPDAIETCDGKDNDCNGTVDDIGASRQDDEDPMLSLIGHKLVPPATMLVVAASIGAPSLVADCCSPATWYADLDHDGFGDPANSEQTCSDIPVGYVSNSDDCDDSDASINPTAQEMCDTIDNDCDGKTDDKDDSVQGEVTWYADSDGDGYGDISAPVQACAAPAGTVDNARDCNDADATINPGKKNCDDLNGDGYADVIVANRGNGDDSTIDSYVYWGSEKGISNSDRTALPTIGARETCVADFNKDGYKDIIFANSYNSDTGANAVSYLYWGKPSGFSSDNRVSLVTQGASACTVDDFDRDGDMDVVFANSGIGKSFEINSYVYRNDGGQFYHRTELPTSNANDVASADLDGDGYPELIFANVIGDDDYEYNIDSRVYWGSATGYSSSSYLPLPTQGAVFVLAQDLNDDGSPELIFANYISCEGAVGSTCTYDTDSFIYWGPDYAAIDRSELATSGAREVAAADFNLDGHLDLVFANMDSDANDYSPGCPVYYGPDFTKMWELDCGNGRAVDVDFINGDLFPDIAISSTYDGDPSITNDVFLGASSGFTDSLHLEFPMTSSQDTEIRDIDGDGLKDVIFSSFQNGNGGSATNGYVLWNSSRGIEDSNRSEPEVEGALHASVADLDLDGNMDIVYSSTGEESAIFWGGDPWIGNGNREGLESSYARMTCIDDLNGDKWPDIVMVNWQNLETGSYTTDSYVYWGSSTGYSPINRIGLPTTHAYTCLLRDLDNDGDKDIVFANTENESTAAIDSYVYWNVEGNFSTANRLGIPTVGAFGVVADDLNKDGIEDLVFSSQATGGGHYLYWGYKNGNEVAYSTPHLQILPSDLGNRATQVKDIDRDGWLDIFMPGMVPGSGSANTYVYWGSSAGFSTNNRLTIGANATTDALVYDLDGDGNTDIILASGWDGDDQTNSYVYWGPFKPFTGNMTSLAGNSPPAVSVSDLNADGKPDLILSCWKNNGNRWCNSRIYYNDGARFVNSPSTILPMYTSVDVVAADLNHDGLDELVFSNSSREDGVWSTESHLYWNSPRGISADYFTPFENVGTASMTVVGGD